MTNSLIDEGLKLMLVGMGTVFVFLTALVIVTTLMSRLVMRFQPKLIASGITDEEVAAISAAISQHRRK
ncbi:MAG: OadG family protein [Woeseiaceae bacterium]|nr:OadG family protein [Woeseiaceae bacterium]MDX2608187.1 OadG family protein [Woeseiaceae bacterium]